VYIKNEPNMNTITKKEEPPVVSDPFVLSKRAIIIINIAKIDKYT